MRLGRTALAAPFAPRVESSSCATLSFQATSLVSPRMTRPRDRPSVRSREQCLGSTSGSRTNTLALAVGSGNDGGGFSLKSAQLSLTDSVITSNTATGSESGL